MKKVDSVDEYLESVPKEMRTAINKLRKTIKAAAPDAEEVISYNMPAFRQKGILVYYAAFKNTSAFSQEAPKFGPRSCSNRNHSTRGKEPCASRPTTPS